MYVLYVIVNKDVKMSKGKIASQVSHAAIDSLLKSKQKIVEKYLCQRKVIVLEADTIEYQNLKKILTENNLKFFPIIDAGHTQVKPHTETCFSVEIVEHEQNYNNIFRVYNLLK